MQISILILKSLYFDVPGKLIKTTNDVFFEFKASNCKEIAHSLNDVLTLKYKKTLKNAALLSLKIGNLNNFYNFCNLFMF